MFKLPNHICAMIRLVALLCPNLCNSKGCNPPGSSLHRYSSGQNTEVDCHVLLQGVFPNQGLNPGLLHCRWILYHLNHQGSPRILEWVAYPFSKGSSQPRDWTQVSIIAGGFFTSWATREAQEYWSTNNSLLLLYHTCPFTYLKPYYIVSFIIVLVLSGL